MTVNGEVKRKSNETMMAYCNLGTTQRIIKRETEENYENPLSQLLAFQLKTKSGPPLNKKQECQSYNL
jgi:hypothetical protein